MMFPQPLQRVLLVWVLHLMILSSAALAASDLEVELGIIDEVQLSARRLRFQLQGSGLILTLSLQDWSSGTLSYLSRFRTRMGLAFFTPSDHKLQRFLYAGGQIQIFDNHLRVTAPLYVCGHGYGWVSTGTSLGLLFVDGPLFDAAMLPPMLCSLAKRRLPDGSWKSRRSLLFEGGLGQSRGQLIFTPDLIHANQRLRISNEDEGPLPEPFVAAGSLQTLKVAVGVFTHKLVGLTGSLMVVALDPAVRIDQEERVYIRGDGLRQIGKLWRETHHPEDRDGIPVRCRIF